VPAPGYRGRFAPSPTGPLHAGSLVAALASWLDAKAHGGQWLVRIEDVDTPRCVAGMDDFILQQLAALGLLPDEPPWRQSQRGSAYAAALEQLAHAGRAYPCGCTRRDIDDALTAQGLTHTRHAERIYPGTCRTGLHGKPARAWRLRVGGTQPWHDRRLGQQAQDLGAAVGDFVLRRADGLWAYQLAVVVDDAEQGITHVVRGEDLADNTPRQIALQQALHLATPGYLHTPLVCAADGHKLSKQNGAAALDSNDRVETLRAALRMLAMPAQAPTLAELLQVAVPAWGRRWANASGAPAVPGAPRT
jgi:glutamyl-Q tRNA(Asp) synthetase